MPYTRTAEIHIYYERNGKGCPVLFLGGIGGELARFLNRHCSTVSQARVL